jgi:hypothetical protein
MSIYIDGDIKILYIVYAFFYLLLFSRFAFSKHCTPPNIYKTHKKNNPKKKGKKWGDIY